MWSGCWHPADLRSPSRLPPAPLPIQCPARTTQMARINDLSPPQVVRWRTPRLSRPRIQERIGGHIATEPEQRTPDQVCEPADPSITERVLVDFEGSELVPSSMPLPPYLQITCDTPLLLDFCMELQPVSQSPAISATQSPPSPFSPSVPPPLSSVAPSRAYRDLSPPGHEEPEAPPPASEGFELPRSVALTPAPALFPPSTSEWTIGLSTTPDSLSTSAPPGSDIASPPLRTYGPSAALWSSPPSTTACSVFALSRSNASSDLWIPSSISGGRHCGSVAAAWILTISTPPQLVGCAVGSILALVAYGHPHGGPHQALPWLLPPSKPLWGTTLAVAWKYILQPLLKAITWMSPPSAPPWTPGFRLLPVNRPPPTSARFTITSPTSRTPSGPPL
ncbi:hypothetical protein DPX16_10578 [Anabarilius grahami]|uniref:Uncharacterized protein n=1 Tax=Anabarilius grahami TaxID=495550 RepID=A0A3N0Z6T7_ANAGA|nr:hypothetical protein DPX16_10578 [Anabarilius grahami]